MDEYVLDTENKVTLQISNDAFYFLKYGEEPLDDANQEEIEEIQEMFPLGFVVEDTFETVEDDLIEATFVPYMTKPELLPSAGINGFSEAFGGWFHEFTITSATEASLKTVNRKTGKVLRDNEIVKIQHFFNKPWIVYSGGMFPLWKKGSITVLQKDSFGILS